MEAIELKPQISKNQVEEAIKRITGVTPTITICQENRIALTIEKDLTGDEHNQINRLALLVTTEEIDEIKAKIADYDDLKARVEKLEKK